MTFDSTVVRYGLFGLIFSVILVLGPDLMPLLLGQDASVWTPINSPQYRFGDNYYYTAWVKEGLDNGFPPGSPSAAEFQNQSLMETLRWFPLFIAAMPGYLISDFRFVYIIDYAFTAFCFFGIPYLVAYRFTRSPLAALAIGVAVLFGQAQWWGHIPSAVGMPGAPRIWLWFSILLGKFLHGSFDLFRMYEYEALQGSFRYINLSISGPILLIYAMLCHLVYAAEKPKYSVLAVVAVMSPLMAFSYPSQALIAYATLGGYMVLAFWRGHKISAAWLLGIGLAAAGILLIGGYVQYIMDVFRQNALWNNIFQKESLSFRDLPWWQYPFMMTINKYTVTGALSLWLVWKNRELRDMVLLFLAISCGLSLCMLFDMPQLWGRFLGRGIDPLWFMVFLVAFAYGAIEKITQERFLRLRYALVGIVLLVPAISFGVYTVHCATNGTRFMPETRWEFLQWVNKNTQKNQTIAAINWDDITFLPIYTGANLMIDNMIIGGRGPEECLTRYLAFWKFMGYPRQLLEARLTDMATIANKRLTSGGNRAKAMNPPLLSEDEYANSQIAEALIYWPYVSTVFDTPVAADNVTTKELVQKLMGIYDGLNRRKVHEQFPFDYIAVSGVERDLRIKTPVPLEAVFENATHKVFRIEP